MGFRKKEIAIILFINAVILGIFFHEIIVKIEKAKECLVKKEEFFQKINSFRLRNYRLEKKLKKNYFFNEIITLLIIIFFLSIIIYLAIKKMKEKKKKKIETFQSIKIIKNLFFPSIYYEYDDYDKKEEEEISKKKANLKMKKFLGEKNFNIPKGKKFYDFCQEKKISIIDTNKNCTNFLLKIMNINPELEESFSIVKTTGYPSCQAINKNFVLDSLRYKKHHFANKKMEKMFSSKEKGTINNDYPEKEILEYSKKSISLYNKLDWNKKNFAIEKTTLRVKRGRKKREDFDDIEELKEDVFADLRNDINDIKNNIFLKV